MNLMDMLTGGGDPDKPSLLGFIGKLPGLLTPGSEGPVPAQGEDMLDDATRKNLRAAYQRSFAANQAKAVASGASQAGVSAMASGAAQDDYGSSVNRAMATMQALKAQRRDDDRRAQLATLLADKGNGLTDQQRTAVNALDDNDQSAVLKSTLFAPPKEPIQAGANGLWVEDKTAPNGWKHIDTPDAGGIPRDANWDEKRGGFAWHDINGPHFSKVAGLAQDESLSGGKPQMETVHVKDPVTGADKLQQMWVKPGATTGVPVGEMWDAPLGGGSRARAMSGRILLGADQVAHFAENVAKVPLSTDVGFLANAFGGHGTTGMLGTTFSMLTNEMSHQDVQTYNVLQAGMARNMAAIEAAGLAPPASLTGAMNAVVYQKNDTNLTKLNKLAEIRQTVDVGIDYLLSSPDVSPAQKLHAKAVRERIHKAIPFTQGQVIQLEYSGKKNYTLKDAIKDMPDDEDGMDIDTSKPVPTE